MDNKWSFSGKMRSLLLLSIVFFVVTVSANKSKLMFYSRAIKFPPADIFISLFCLNS